MVLVKFCEETGRGEEIIRSAVAGIIAPHISAGFGEVAIIAVSHRGEGVVGATGVNDSAVKRRVPLEVIHAQRADGTERGGFGALEDSGETGNASLGDCFENDVRFM